jgi:hypothetical protein
MVEPHGIGVDDLPWIYHDQFVHYVQLAHDLGDPHDWPGLRQDLLEALTAAFGLDDPGDCRGLLTPSQRRALAVLDVVRRLHHPAVDWLAFRDALWQRRQTIRPDLPPTGPGTLRPQGPTASSTHPRWPT